MTARDIINTVIEQVVLPSNGWEVTLEKAELLLIMEYEIMLDTELVEA